MAHYPHDIHYFPHSIPQQPYPFPYHHNLSHHDFLPDDMPRPAFFSYSPDVIKHRKRTSRSQRKVLEEAFRQNPKPSQYTRKLLIHQTGMDRRAIQVWFQNRRAKEKKLAAKAQTGTESTTDPANLDPKLEAAEDDLDSDTEPQEGDQEGDQPETAAPTQPPAPPSASQDSANSNTANNGIDYHPAQDASTPSPRDSSTPPATNSASNSSPRPPSTNSGTSPSPPALWHSHHSTPAMSNNKRSLTLEAAAAYAFRRESAPAPLGMDSVRPSPFLHTPSFVPAGDDNNSRVAIWDAGTPPSPLSTSDIDLGTLNGRRGSLPALGTYNDPPSVPSPIRSSGLQALPADPNVRRVSLERTRLRLASHPYAPQVAAANRNFAMSLSPDYQNSMVSRHRPSLPHSMTVPTANCIPTPAQMTMTTSGSSSAPNWDTSPLPTPDMTDGPVTAFPSYIRPRRHGSYHSGMYTAPHRTYTEIVPGPLPAPNFSFGTAPAAISEGDGKETGDEEDNGTGTSVSVDEMHRFGSFASVASTGSSATSAWYSDVQSTGLVPPSDDLETPTAWQPDARRQSCPAPFVFAFSGLHVNNDGSEATSGNSMVGSQHLPVTNSLGFDVSKQSDDLSLGVDDSIQMHGKMSGFQDPGVMGFYPDAFNNNQTGFQDDFRYAPLSGYDMNSDGIDSTPTSSNTPGIVYPFYQ